MHRKFIIAAAILGALGVALGAFGAHGLQKLTTDEKILHSYQTGVQYQVYHALALLGIAALYDKLAAEWMRWAGNFFIYGTILFSGSLYVISFLKIEESNLVRFVGPVTPLGGLLFVGGWVCLLIGALKSR